MGTPVLLAVPALLVLGSVWFYRQLAEPADRLGTIALDREYRVAAVLLTAVRVVQRIAAEPATGPAS